MTGFLKKYFKIAWQNKLLSFVWLTAIVVACCFCYVRLVQHNIFQTSAFDLGIHASVAWNTAHGRLFYDSLRDINYLADHFSPIYLLLFPIMRLFTPAKALLVLQSASLFLAFPAVYLLGRRFTHSRLVSVGIAFLFLSMPYLHQINNFDFHPVALAVP